MKQVAFKLQSYSGMIWTLMVMQLLGLLMGGGGFAGGSIGSGSVTLSYAAYNANSIIALTMLWIFISSILITTKAYQLDDYSFVASRKTSHYANGLTIVIASLFGALTGMLSSYVIRIIFLLRAEEVIVSAAPYNIGEWLTGVSVTFLYLLLFAFLGYCIGMVFQVHVFLRVGLILMAIIFFFFGGRVNGLLLETVAGFYIMETSFLLFLSKIVISVVTLFMLTILITSRMEARA